MEAAAAPPPHDQVFSGFPLPKEIFLLILSFIDYLHLHMIAMRVNRYWHRCCWESMAFYGFGLWDLDPALIGTMQHPGIWKQLRPDFVNSIRRVSLRFKMPSISEGPEWRIPFDGILGGPVTAMPQEWPGETSQWTKLEHLHVKPFGIYRNPKHAMKYSLEPLNRFLPNLRRLDFEYLQLHGDGSDVANLALLTGLQELHLRHFGLPYEKLENFSLLTALRSFVDPLPWHGILLDSFCQQLGQLTLLERLTLRRPRVANYRQNWTLALLTRLEFLDLEDTLLDDENLFLLHLPRLTHLIGLSVPVLGLLTGLRRLTIKGPSPFDLPHLQYLCPLTQLRGFTLDVACLQATVTFNAMQLHLHWLRWIEFPRPTPTMGSYDHLGPGTYRRQKRYHWQIDK